MTLDEMKSKTPAQLKEAVALASEKLFKLKMRAANGEQVKTHLYGETRKEIARLLTMLKQVEGK